LVKETQNKALLSATKEQVKHEILPSINEEKGQSLAGGSVPRDTVMNKLAADRQQKELQLRNMYGKKAFKINLNHQGAISNKNITVSK
jgi:hypothetical protein